MKRQIARVLLALIGWRAVGAMPDTPKAVLVVAPHTSNWDFPVMLLLVNGMPGHSALGALGCGISNALIGWLALVGSVFYILSSERLKAYRLMQGWRRPCWRDRTGLWRAG